MGKDTILSSEAVLRESMMIGLHDCAIETLIT